MEHEKKRPSDRGTPKAGNILPKRSAQPTLAQNTQQTAVFQFAPVRVEQLDVLHLVEVHPSAPPFVLE